MAVEEREGVHDYRRLPTRYVSIVSSYLSFGTIIGAQIYKSVVYLYHCSMHNNFMEKKTEIYFAYNFTIRKNIIIHAEVADSPIPLKPYRTVGRTKGKLLF